MSFEHPAWLALLAALPILWFLHRQRRGPRVLRVSSVQPFRAAADEPRAARPRRRIDVVLMLLLAAATALAVAAAGPRLGGGAAQVYVIVDTSASMDAKLTTGAVVIDDALTRARDVLGDAVPIVHPLDDPAIVAPGLGDLRPFSRDADGLPRPNSADGDGLPGSLAPHLELARSRGFSGVMLVTDRTVVLPGVVVVGPSAAAGPNSGIASVVLDGEEMIVSVRSSARVEVDVGVTADARHVTVRVPAGGVAMVRFPAPRPLGSLSVELDGGDSLGWDDSARVLRARGVRTARLVGDPPFDRIRRALDACDVRIVEGDAPVVVRRGGPPLENRRGVLHFAVAPGSLDPFTVAGERGLARGAALQGRGLLGAGLPSPNATVATTGRIDGRIDGRVARGEPGILDAAGVLAVSAEGVVLCCLDPEDPASTWHEEPSFPVFVAAALDHLVGVDRLEVTGVSAAEIDVALAAVPLPTPDEVRALERGGEGRSLAPGLAVLAACFTLGAVLAGRRLGR